MPRGGRDGGYRSHPGSGTRLRNNVYVNCMFDPETFDAIRATALREHTSIAYQVRKFVDWGMDASVGNHTQQAIRSAGSKPRGATSTLPPVTVPGNARTLAQQTAAKQRK